MSGLADTQRRMLAWIEGDGDCPPGVAVYRSSVRNGRRDALAAAHPRVLEALGDAAFASLADRYARAHPPASGDLHGFGDRLAAFMAGDAVALAALADVARRDWAKHRAFHAEDVAPLDFGALARVDPADQPGLRLRLHPSVAWGPGWRVWRDAANDVREAAIDPAEEAMLAALAQGATLDVVFELAGPRAAEALARYAGDGLFAAFEAG